MSYFVKFGTITLSRIKTMPFTESRQFKTREEKETIGHQIESKVADFLEGSFDFVEKIERTKHGGLNDKKGIDLVVTFQDGSKMAIDVTANDGLKVDRKIEGMRTNSFSAVLREVNEMGEVIVEKPNVSIPKGLIRVNSAPWEEYNVERVGDEVIVYMPDTTRIREEKDILQQLLRQIKYLSEGNIDYMDATKSIKKMLQEALEELTELEKEFT